MRVTEPEAGPPVRDPGLARRKFRAYALSAGPVALSVAVTWFGVYTFINAYYTRGLHHTASEWTSLTLFYAAGMFAWPLVCVQVAGVLGHRKSVTLAMLIAAAGYLAVGAVRNEVVLRVLMVLLAFPPSAFTVSWLPMVIDAGGERPGRALATYFTVSTTVAAAALLTGGRLLHAVGYRTGFVIVGAACAVCAAIFVVSARPLLAQPRKKQTTILNLSGDQFLALAKGPFLFLMIAGTMMEPFNFHTANQLFPNLARDVHGMGERAIATVVALGRLPALASLAVMARIIDHVRVTVWYGIGLMLAGVCIALAGAAQGSVMLVAMYFGYYLFHGLVWGTNVAATNRAVEPGSLDAAFAITLVLSNLSCFLVGFAHYKMLHCGLPLPNVFNACGIGGACAGVLMIVYSYTRFGAWSKSRL